MANFLTINPGSTAVKYVLYSASGEVLEKNDFSRKEDKDLGSAERLWLSGLNDVERIGIRIVHGVSQKDSAVIDEGVLRRIEDGKRFAPLHNEIALNCIGHLFEIFEGTEIVAVFDTEFHKDLPDSSKIYPIPLSITEEFEFYRYGFHGLALQSVMNQLPALTSERASTLPRKLIVAHLGGGSSITAIRDAKSVDTSMGLTPLEGIMMITRSGSLGPEIPRLIGEVRFLSPQDVSDMLNNQSGFYGLTGSKDTLDIITRAEKGEEPYRLALDIFVHEIVKRIYSYYGVLQGCDALVFSGGIGYGNEYLRKIVLEKTKLIGISEENTFVVKVDEAKIIFEKISKLI